MYDIVIVGSGPAGVSAAFPLLEAGKKVLMVDWGNSQAHSQPKQPQYSVRLDDEQQWKWMLGEDFHSLNNSDAVSPKLRVPYLKHVFADFVEKLDAKTNNFFIAGSLATGGLSNAWGAGVASLGGNELLCHFGAEYRGMFQSYSIVAKRMGLSGKEGDDLKSYFNVDGYCDEGVSLDPLPSYLLTNHNNLSQNEKRLKLGRSRIAVLNRAEKDREPCDSRGNCLWGCSREAIYSAKHDLRKLLSHPNFTLKTNYLVTKIINAEDYVRIECVDRATEKVEIKSKAVFLGAGTMSSTKILINSLNVRNRTLPLLSCPTAAFLLFIPKFFGRKNVAPEFGLGQVSFNVKSDSNNSAFGSFFSTQSLPLYEFSRHVPIGISNGMHFLSKLMSSCLVGNVFLPGTLSQSKIIVDERGNMKIEGQYDPSYKTIGKEIERKINSHFRRLKALVVPFSFKFTDPGACIHYAATFPMRPTPKNGECDMSGRVKGLENVFLIDGSSLPTLTEKSHTLTIMANSDRIARKYLETV